eukprot:g9137.t1
MGLSIRQVEFMRQVGKDQTFVVGAILIVWVLLFLHTRSFFLANVASLQILLTLPFALFWYRVVGQAVYFTQLHVTGLFLACGIGADDVFILSDCYTSAKQEIIDSKTAAAAELAAELMAFGPATTTGGGGTTKTSADAEEALEKEALRLIGLNSLGVQEQLQEDQNQKAGDGKRIPSPTYRYRLTKRDYKIALLKALSRAYVAVFNTSFTTASAFVATAVSPIMPISGFGIYAALLIISNYIFAMVNLPAVLYLSDNLPRWMKCCATDGCLASCCGPCLPYSDGRRRTRSKAEEPTVDVGAGVAERTEVAAAIDDVGSGSPTMITTSNSSKAAAPDGPPGPNANASNEPEVDQVQDVEPEQQKAESFWVWYFLALTMFEVRVCTATATAPASNMKSFRLFLAPLFLIVGISSWSVYAISEAFQLRPPVEEEKWFPAGHMFQDFRSDQKLRFRSSPTSEYETITVTYGLQEPYVVRENYNRWVPHKNRGRPVFTTGDEHSGGSISVYDAFPVLLDICDRLMTAQCPASSPGSEMDEGCKPPSGAEAAYTGTYLENEVLASSASSSGGSSSTTRLLTLPGTHLCPLTEFREWWNTRAGNLTHYLGTTSGGGSSSTSVEAQAFSGANYTLVFPPPTTSPAGGGGGKQAFEEPFVSSFRVTQTPGRWGFPVAVSESRTEQWSFHIGVINGKIKFLSFSFRASLLQLRPHRVRGKMYDTFEALVRRGLPTSPHLGEPIQTTFLAWPWYGVEVALQETLFLGMVLCFPLSFCVLLLATQNTYLASFAMLTIVQIVGTVMGTFKYGFGWAPLGAVEVISGIIVIGFSIDYTLHMGHIWVEATEEGLRGRLAKTRYSLEHMGSTIFAGASTTAAAGLFMFGCTLTFFTKMATMISRRGGHESNGPAGIFYAGIGIPGRFTSGSRCSSAILSWEERLQLGPSCR